MSKKFVAVAILGVFLFSGVANAQTNNLPRAGITPDSPLFFLDRFFEDIGTFFTFGEANKARRYLAIAEERLAEAQVLAERQDDENTTKAVELYEEQLAKVKERAVRTVEPDVEGEVADAMTKHLSVLDQVLELVPEQAREHVQAARERTMMGQLQALRAIAPKDLERAAGIFATAAEGRLQAAKARAERGGDDEEEAEEVEEVLSEYEKYAQFGEEISQVAQLLGEGATEVRTLIEQATEQHLQVLQDVKSKVNPQAQDAIDRAMQNAERIKELLPADIPGRVGPGAGGQREGAPESGGTLPEQGQQFIPPAVQELIPQQPEGTEQNDEGDWNGDAYPSGRLQAPDKTEEPDLTIKTKSPPP